MMDTDDGQVCDVGGVIVEPQPCNASLYATMFEVIGRQMDLADIRPNQGFGARGTGTAVLPALVQIMRAPWLGAHTCHLPDTDDHVDCKTCQVSGFTSNTECSTLENLRVDPSIAGVNGNMFRKRWSPSKCYMI
jgi:hypothetical protein